jgi:hypothetical protein
MAGAAMAGAAMAGAAVAGAAVAGAVVARAVVARAVVAGAVVAGAVVAGVVAAGVAGATAGARGCSRFGRVPCMQQACDTRATRRGPSCAERLDECGEARLQQFDTAAAAEARNHVGRHLVVLVKVLQRHRTIIMHTSVKGGL